MMVNIWWIDYPWVHAVKLVLATNTATCRHVRGLLTDNNNDYEVGLNYVKRSISESTSSRCITYQLFNPNLTVDVCYLRGGNVGEHYRI